MNATFRWIREDGATVPIEIEFKCSRYIPATYFDPAEGGEIEEIEFALGGEEGEFPPAWLDEFRSLYEEGGSLQDQVDEVCFANAQEDDDGPDYWDPDY